MAAGDVRRARGATPKRAPFPGRKGLRHDRPFVSRCAGRADGQQNPVAAWQALWVAVDLARAAREYGEEAR